MSQDGGEIAGDSLPQPCNVAGRYFSNAICSPAQAGSEKQQLCLTGRRTALLLELP